MSLCHEPPNDPFEKAQKEPRGSFEVICGSSEHDIYRVSEKTLVEVPSQTMVALASTTVPSFIPVILLLLPVLHGKIDADAFLEDKLHALLSDTVTEMDKLGRGARCGCAEGFKTAKVLVVGVFCKLGYHLFVGYIAKMLQHKQACHQSDWLGRVAVIRTEKRGEGVLEE